MLSFSVCFKTLGGWFPKKGRCFTTVSYAFLNDT